MTTSRQPEGEREHGASLILGAVDRWAQRTPDAIAVTAPDGTLTFAELAAKTRDLTMALLTAGAGPGLPVGLGYGRTTMAVPALLAVWRTGATAVPVDDRLPADRLEFQLQDADIRLLLGTLPASALSEDVRTIDTTATAESKVDSKSAGPRDCAYLIYTSGTTGRPKGVEVGYGALATFLAAISTLDLAPDGVGFNPLPPAFDGWLWCTLLYLLHGQGVALVDPTRGVGGTADLASAIADVKPRTVCLSPSLLAACPDDMPSVEVMVVAGEQCPPSLVERFGGKHRLINVYGPTEATIAATWADSAAGDDVLTIGRALPGYTTYVLDGNRQPVPAGTDGELYIGGPAVALGYRNRPGLTAAKFVPNPFDGIGARLYRTGDQVRSRADGQLEFLGRIDDQVKVRAFRVELGEIERTAAAAAGARAAAAFVLASGDALGLAIVTEPGVNDQKCVHEVLTLCTAKLPEYMVPVVVRPVRELPTNPNGKADRKALAGLIADTQPATGGRGPTTERERQVCEVWSSVLPYPVNDVDANFFAAGGHSLLASRAVIALRKVTGLRVSVRNLLEHPTPRAFARELDRITEAAGR